MAEKKKRPGLLKRVVGGVSEYLKARKQMSERVQAPTAPPAAQEPAAQAEKPKKKKKRGGIGGVMDTIKERRRKMDETLKY